MTRFIVTLKQDKDTNQYKTIYKGKELISSEYMFSFDLDYEATIIQALALFQDNGEILEIRKQNNIQYESKD